MEILTNITKENYAVESNQAEQTLKMAAGAEMQPLCIVKEAKKSSSDGREWVYEDKNGIMRLYVTKLAHHIQENEPYFYTQDGSGSSKKWYWYNGSKYVQITNDEVKGMIKRFIPPEAAQPGDVNKVFNVLATDDVDSPHKIDVNELNSDENIINFTNGIYDIREHKLKAHSPEYKSTLQIQCDYKPVSKCTNNGVFDKFINHFFNGDQEQINLMLQVIGLVISNLDATRAKQAVFVVGDGNTGKSQLKKFAIRLIGEEFNTSIDLKTLETRFGRSALYQKRLAGSHDMSFEYVKELNTFKNITGGDSLNSEFKGQNYFEMKFRGLLWFCCNKLPMFGGDRGDWVYKRICIMKALGKVYDQGTEWFDGIVYRDPDLIEKLWEEREYIVSLAIEALYKYIENNQKFSTTSLNEEYLHEYKLENNSITAFVNACCVKRTCKDEYSKSKIYAVYREWCEDNKRIDKVGKTAFKEELEKVGLGNITTINGIQYYSQITLSEQAIAEYGSAIRKCS